MSLSEYEVEVLIPQEHQPSDSEAVQASGSLQLYPLTPQLKASVETHVDSQQSPPSYSQEATLLLESQ